MLHDGTEDRWLQVLPFGAVLGNGDEIEAVKVSLATRKAEVVELYQPMTFLMRQCQDSITECMEAMLVELKRDHSLVSRLSGGGCLISRA